MFLLVFVFSSPGYTCESIGGSTSKYNHRCPPPPPQAHMHTLFSPSVYAPVNWTYFSSDIRQIVFEFFLLRTHINSFILAEIARHISNIKGIAAALLKTLFSIRQFCSGDASCPLRSEDFTVVLIDIIQLWGGRKIRKQML